MIPEEDRLLNPVRVKYSDDHSFIFITINPREVLNQSLSPEEILEALLDSGFSSFEYQLDQVIMDELIGLPWKRLNKVIVRRIAHRIEFDLKIQLSQDHMQAFLTIKTAFFNELISRERLSERLDHAGIHQGILEDRLQEILDSNEATSIEIARGKEPQHGLDGWAERLVNALNLLPEYMLPAGTPLLLRHPPKEGQDGFTVTGRVLAAKKGLPIVIKPGEGCAFSDESQDLILAKQEGIPIYSNYSVRMDELHYLHVDELDDQIYPHSLEITGDISDGSDLKIQTHGHLIFNGEVNGGFFSAGAELLIKGEVRGPVWLQSVDQMSLLNAKEALIHCSGTLRVQEFLEQCQVYIFGCLEAPEAWLAGGVVYFQNKMIVYQLGQPATIPTQIERGADDYFLNRLNFLQAERKQIKEKLGAILKAMIRSPKDYKTRGLRFHKAQQTLQRYDEAYAREEAKLLCNQQQASVYVLGAIYPAVTLKTESFTFCCEETRWAQKISFDVSGLNWKPLPSGHDMRPEPHTT